MDMNVLAPMFLLLCQSSDWLSRPPMK